MFNGCHCLKKVGFSFKLTVNVMYSLQICFPVSSFSVRHYCFSVHKNLSHTNTSHCMYHIRLVHESLPSEYILSHIPGRYTVETPPSFRNGKHKKKNTTTVIFFCIYYNFWRTWGD
jgi:hypothetical protein